MAKHILDYMWTALNGSSDLWPLGLYDLYVPQAVFLQTELGQDHRLWETVPRLKLVLVHLLISKWKKKSIAIMKNKNWLFSRLGRGKRWELESPIIQESIRDPEKRPSLIY